MMHPMPQYTETECDGNYYQPDNKMENHTNTTGQIEDHKTRNENPIEDEQQDAEEEPFDNEPINDIDGIEDDEAENQ